MGVMHRGDFERRKVETFAKHFYRNYYTALALPQSVQRRLIICTLRVNKTRLEVSGYGLVNLQNILGSLDVLNTAPLAK